LEPLLRKRQQEANTVNIGEIESQMGGHRNHRRGKRPEPFDRLSGNRPHQEHRQKRHHRHGNQRVREMTVIMQIVQGTPGQGDDVDVGSVGGKYQDGRGKRAPAFQAGPAEEQAGRCVGEGVHRGVCRSPYCSNAPKPSPEMANPLALSGFDVSVERIGSFLQADSGRRMRRRLRGSLDFTSGLTG